jgi:hypothetical protein
MPSEVLTLERRQLDVAAGAIRLEPGSTKNDEGRMVFEERDARREAAPELHEGLAAGVPGMLRHDFRRTAVRNMVNAVCPSAWP